MMALLISTAIAFVDMRAAMSLAKRRLAVNHEDKAIVITQIFSKYISVNLIMNRGIPWKSIDSSACPLDVRPPFVRPRFSPPASWLKPRQGWPVYSAGTPTPSFFLFFSGASLARRSNCPPAAPLKNKENGGGSRFSPINRSPLRGFWPLTHAGGGPPAHNPGGVHQPATIPRDFLCSKWAQTDMITIMRNLPPRNQKFASLGLLLALLALLAAGCLSERAEGDYRWQQANPNYSPPTPSDPRPLWGPFGLP
jgi:hypothetical protein